MSASKPNNESANITPCGGESERRVSRTEPELIEPTAKNGAVTAIGVILGFSVNFIAGWAFQWQMPKAGWSLIDLLPAGMLFGGVACLTSALYGMLLPYRLPVEEFPKRIKTAIAGVSLVFAGVLVAMLLNAWQQVSIR